MMSGVLLRQCVYLRIMKIQEHGSRTFFINIRINTLHRANADGELLQSL